MDIHIRAQRDFGSLTETEQLTRGMWLFTWITQTEEGWSAREQGSPHMAWVDRYVVGVAQVLRSDGGRTLWPRLRGFYDASFVSALDEVVAASDQTQLESVFGD